jgi:hypothetical protein
MTQLGEGSELSEIARAIEIPFQPDLVLGPELVHQDLPTDALYYVTEQDEPVRVTFERKDAVRVCRGEYLPYEEGDPPGEGLFSLFIVDNSRWLRERHAYESRFYRDCYEWGGDVDEMLTDYDHYLLHFHDEFVEAIAAGIWFEKHPEPFAGDQLPAEHPLAPLPASAMTEPFQVGEVTWEVRTNPKSLEEIRWGACYCSQTLYEFRPDRDGSGRPDFRLDVRERRGIVRATVRNWFGTAQARTEGIPSLAQARALAEPHFRQIDERRRTRRE